MTLPWGLAVAATVASVVLAVIAVRCAAARGRSERDLDALRRRMADVTGDLEESRDMLEQAYDQLQQTQAELVSTAKLAALGNLVRGLAHEINTPLGALASNHDVTHRALERLQVILEDEVVDPSELVEVRKIVQAVDGVQATSSMAVERMRALVQSLRAFGRPDHSDLGFVDLHDALESTLQLLSHELRDEIRVVREFGELPVVECFPGQVNQVLMNLLVNAIHALPGPGTITIRTSADDEGVTVEIEDTGVGIGEENLERIFDPGFTTKGARVGMGMGLIISRQIVDRHGGSISVESELGRGTTFQVRLPLRLARDASRTGAAGSTDEEPG